jgi:small-conductance mechanosensitive channel
MFLPHQTAETDIDELTSALTNSELDAFDFATAAVILVAALILTRAARFGIGRLVGRKGNNTFLSDLLGRLVSYLVLAFGLVYALDELGVSVGPLLGALGIAGLVLAFALQNIVENFVAGLIVQVSRPFSPNDEITSGDCSGTVVSVDARTITIHTPDGETVKIPSAELIKNPITNHTLFGQRRSTVEVGVAYGTDLERARQVVSDALATVGAVDRRPAPEVLASQFGESSIDLLVLYWHSPKIAEELQARSDVILAIDRAFAANDITIPFPQRTVHFPSTPAGPAGAP